MFLTHILFSDLLIMIGPITSPQPEHVQVIFCSFHNGLYPFRFFFSIHISLFSSCSFAACFFLLHTLSSLFCQSYHCNSFSNTFMASPNSILLNFRMTCKQTKACFHKRGGQHFQPPLLGTTMSAKWNSILSFHTFPKNIEMQKCNTQI